MSENWEKRYREGDYKQQDPHALVTQFAPKLTSGRALDLACGAGRHALWLAEHGWDVTAVDCAPTAMEIVRKAAADRGVPIRALVADLQRHEFTIVSSAYDLIIVVNYLQRDLFSSIRSGIRPGGAVIAVIAMTDDDPAVPPMNPAYLLKPGELRSEFKGWKLLHDFEGKAAPGRRAAAEIVAVL